MNNGPHRRQPFGNFRFRSQNDGPKNAPILSKSLAENGPPQGPGYSIRSAPLWHVWQKPNQEWHVWTNSKIELEHPGMASSRLARPNSTGNKSLDDCLGILQPEVAAVLYTDFRNAGELDLGPAAIILLFNHTNYKVHTHVRIMTSISGPSHSNSDAGVRPSRIRQEFIQYIKRDHSRHFVFVFCLSLRSKTDSHIQVLDKIVLFVHLGDLQMHVSTFALWTALQLRI